MISPIKNPKITADFYEMRPLSANVKTHIHGAVDIGAPTGTTIYAPEDGEFFYYVSIRPSHNMYWPKSPKINGKEFPFGNYFYDMYGGVTVLFSEDRKRTHIFTHAFMNQLFNKKIKVEKIVEQPEKKRFCIFCIYSKPKKIKEGDLLSYVGDAGYSTGPHLHYEIHNGLKWNKHEDRINPMELLNL